MSVLFLLSLPPLPHPTPLGHHRAPGWTPYVRQQLSIVFHMIVYIRQDYFLICPTLSFPCCVHKSVLHWVHQYPFASFHIYALIYDTCFSLFDLLHSV